MQYKAKLLNKKTITLILAVFVPIAFMIIYGVINGTLKELLFVINVYIPFILFFGYFLLKYVTASVNISEKIQYKTLFTKTNINKKDIKKIVEGQENTLKRIKTSEQSFFHYGLNIIGNNNSIFIDKELFKLNYKQICAELSVKNTDKPHIEERKKTLVRWKSILAAAILFIIFYIPILLYQDSHDRVFLFGLTAENFKIWFPIIYWFLVISFLGARNK